MRPAWYIEITRKDVFCLAFYFKWKYFVLIDYILSEIICLFCLCVLFSNTYPKIKFTIKNWHGLCNFYSKVFFFFFFFFFFFVFPRRVGSRSGGREGRDFLSVKIFFIFLLNLNYGYFTTILWKLQKKWTSGTCWKSTSKLPTLQVSA